MTHSGSKKKVITVDNKELNVLSCFIQIVMLFVIVV